MLFHFLENEKQPLIRIMKRGIDPYKEYLRSGFAVSQEMSPIHNSRLAFDLLKPVFNPECEEFWLISLNTHLETKNLTMIARGTLNYCPVHPRDLFREAIKANSFAMIIAHNHPSLDPSPTPQDIQLTKKFSRIGKLIQIPILDHIVFTNEKYFSFKENQLI